MWSDFLLGSSNSRYRSIVSLKVCLLASKFLIFYLVLICFHFLQPKFSHRLICQKLHTNISKIDDVELKKFVQKGIGSKDERSNSLEELYEAYKNL